MILYQLMKKRGFALLLILLVIFNTKNIYAYVKADNPVDAQKSTAALNGYSQEEWAKLMDNDLEYREIAELIHNFNPYISDAYKEFKLNSDRLSLDINELSKVKRDLSDLYDNAKAAGDNNSSALFNAQLKHLDKIISSTNKSKTKFDKNTSIANSSIRQEEAKMVLLAKELMIQYNVTKRNRKILESSLNLSLKVLEDKNKMKEQKAIGDDIYNKAYLDYTKALSEYNAIKDMEERFRKNLITICGWDINAEPVIHDISEIDLEKINSINLLEDTNKAIGNNYDLISFRHTKYKKSPAKNESRQLSEDAIVAEIKADILLLYNELLSNLTNYKKAELSYKAGNIEKLSYEINYKKGAISNTVYMAKTLEVDNLFRDYDMARLELLSSYEKYMAGVNGYIE